MFFRILKIFKVSLKRKKMYRLILNREIGKIIPKIINSIILVSKNYFFFKNISLNHLFYSEI